MRKLILKMSQSVDGFVAGPNGEVAWLYDSLDDAATAWLLDTLWNAGVHIMGSRTFRGMSAYWPASREPFAAPMNEIPKVVFSTNDPRPSSANQKSWTEARVASGDLATEIRRLKEEPGKDILAHGGASFAQSLVKTGLIDEYRLLMHPVALGAGLSLFPPASEPLQLRLAGTTSFPAGAIAQIYRPK